MRKVRLLEEAVIEATEAADYYERERPGWGAEFYSELEAALDLLEGDLVPLVAIPPKKGGIGFKRLILSRFPYDLVVLEQDGELLVLAIASHAQRPGYWLSRV